MQLTLQRDSDIPLYRQIVHAVRDLIRSGALAPGHRLPTVRQLASDLGVTRLTAHSAYSELQAEGLIESHVGRGTYVAADARSAAMPDTAPQGRWESEGVLAELLSIDERRVISFAQAFPSVDSFPVRELGASITRALRDPAVLGYGPVQGEAGLREELAALLLDRGIAISPDHMLITAGAQQGIDVAIRALSRPGDPILAEQPCYPGTLEIAAHADRHVVGVPIDEGGIVLGALRAACEKYHPRLLYTVPTFQNPTGVTLEASRRAALLALAREYDMTIIEDDAYGFMPLDGPASPTLLSEDRDGRVVYISSFSKVLAPGFRLGTLIASPALLPALAAVKGSSDLVCSLLLQRAAADYLRRGHMEPHVQAVRALYRERRDVMLEALREHMPGCTWTEPRGGLSLWVTLPETVEESRVVRDALEAGVGVAPGRVFFAGAAERGHMRLSFSMQSTERIERGIRILGQVLTAQLNRRTRTLSLPGRMVGPMV